MESLNLTLHQQYHQAWVNYQENPTPENGREFKRLKALWDAEQRREREQEAAEQAQQQPEPQDYRGQHGAPDHLSGAPLHDLTQNGTYPDDVYGPNGFRLYYGEESPGSFGLAMRLRGKPNKLVQIFRSVPLDAPKRINPGDWVTLSRAYAQKHGRGNLGRYRTVSKLVHARDVFTAGDSIAEWGYDPQPRSD